MVGDAVSVMEDKLLAGMGMLMVQNIEKGVWQKLCFFASSEGQFFPVVFVLEMNICEHTGPVITVPKKSPMRKVNI